MTRPTRRAALGTLLAAAALPAAAAPAARLIDPVWRSFGAGGDPDHGAWARILAARRSLGPDGIARFDYAAQPRGEVEAYVAALAAVDPTTLRANAAFAYWANLYNALTVDVVLAHYPVASIRDIGGGLFAPGPWREKRVTVKGRDLSLDDIEHGIMRPVWQDARVHYAVNCAALGCPNLAAEPFTGARLAAMLDAGARAYVNHPRGAALTERGLVVSSIYRWFREDFGGSDAGVRDHLRAFAAPDFAARLADAPRIVDDRYDWGLNAP